MTFKINFCVWYEERVNVNFFPNRYTVVSTPFVEKIILAHWNILASLVKSFRTISGLSIPFHLTICLSLCKYHTILITVTLESFENQEV